MKNFKTLTNSAIIKTLGAVNSILGKQGYSILKKEELSQLKKFTLNILNTIQQNEEITSIVFSKDRAMQLHAFLLSYIQKVKNKRRMYILYKCTNTRHQKSYDELQETFYDQNFIFINEADFRENLLQILKSAEADKIILFVDDMIFTHEVDYDELRSINTNTTVFTLSRGRDFEYSVVLNKSITPPPFSEFKNNMLSFRWDFSKEFSDWTFPLGVSGYMFGRQELAAMFDAVPFKAPNSLESAMQVFIPYFINRDGICYEYATCIGVQANIVQEEGTSNNLDTYSIAQLLDLWEEGKRINLNEFYNKPILIAQILKFSFIPKNETVTNFVND